MSERDTIHLTITTVVVAANPAAILVILAIKPKAKVVGAGIAGGIGRSGGKEGRENETKDGKTDHDCVLRNDTDNRWVCK